MKLSTKSHLLLIILLFAILPYHSKCQSICEKSKSNLKTLSEIKTEKVHLHLDRKIFSPGEDLWFSAYLVDGTFHNLTATSNNLHVELVAPDGTIALSQVTLIHNGIGHGDFKLDKTKIIDGTYRIRAYTNHMRNFDAALFFEEEILVTSNQNKKNGAPQQTQKLSLQFFPEGGNLVGGVTNRVAFHVTNQHGKGQKAAVTVYNQNTDKIVETETVHNGMGQFMFIPEKNKLYYARFTTSNFESEKIKLPKPSINYSITVSYIVQSRGKLFSSNSISIKAPQTLVRINKKEMPAGISSITVFDENGIAVAERLVYNQIKPELNISVKTNKTAYKNRDKVTLQIETRNKADEPVPASLSMAVISNNIIETQNRFVNQSPGIQASILLNADLKGHVENPAYYFANFNKTKHYKLDLALLTHGWRKYVWKEKVLEPELKMDYAFENGFTFSGTARSLALKRPIANGKVSLVMSEEGFYYDEVNTDKKGKFIFKNTHLMDTTTVVFQAYTKNNKRNSVIELDPYLYASASTTPLQFAHHFEPDNQLTSITEHANEIMRLKDSLEAKNNKWLDEITIKGKKKKEDNHFRIYKEADKVIKVDDQFAGYNDIFEIIKGRVSGVKVFGHCPDVQVTIRGFHVIDTLDANANSSIFLLDGTFVSTDIICMTHPSQVDKIEVLKGAKAAIFGSRAMNGIIAIYTKEGGATWEHVDIGLVREKQPGYYRAREFYTPNYDEDQNQFEGADYRNTLYWNPQITTGKNGKATLSFFTSDDNGSYQITTEGIGIKDGSMANAVISIVVSNK